MTWFLGLRSTLPWRFVAWAMQLLLQAFLGCGTWPQVCNYATLGLQARSGWSLSFIVRTTNTLLSDGHACPAILEAVPAQSSLQQSLLAFLQAQGVYTAALPIAAAPAPVGSALIDTLPAARAAIIRTKPTCRCCSRLFRLCTCRGFHLVFHFWILLILLVVLHYRMPRFGCNLAAIANLSADVGEVSGG